MHTIVYKTFSRHTICRFPNLCQSCIFLRRWCWVQTLPDWLSHDTLRWPTDLTPKQWGLGRLLELTASFLLATFFNIFLWSSLEKGLRLCALHIGCCDDVPHMKAVFHQTICLKHTIQSIQSLGKPFFPKFRSNVSASLQHVGYKGLQPAGLPCRPYQTQLKQWSVWSNVWMRRANKSIPWISPSKSIWKNPWHPFLKIFQRSRLLIATNGIWSYTKGCAWCGQ